MSYYYSKKGVWALNEVTDKINLNSWDESKGRSFYSFGFDVNGSLANGLRQSKNSPTQIGSELWDNFSAGDGYCLATRPDGSLWVWGRNNHGQLGTKDTRSYSSPTQIVGSDVYWRYLSASKEGGNHSLAIKHNGTLWAWGLNDYGQLGLSGDADAQDYFSRTNISAPISIFGSDWSLCSAGAWSSLAIRGEGSLYTWGRNDSGQLGSMENTTHYSSPVQVPGRWKFAQMYGESTLGITVQNNALYCWGSNSRGQLGRNNTTNAASPIFISPGWKQVKGGGSVVVGIKTDGTMWAWGNGVYGTLGQDLIVRKTSPVGVLGTAWASVSASKFGSHVLAVKNNNTLFHFGSNTFGQSGLNYSGDVSTQSSPTQIIGSDWAIAGAGLSNSYCVKQNGTLFAWGANVFGQIGNNGGVGINSSSPVQIPGTSWASVFANGDSGVFALRNDASLYAWGRNDLGQIGVGDTANRSSPTQIPGTTWAGVAPGRYHTLLLRSDSSLFAVGINTNGELGTNNRTNGIGPALVLGTGYDNPSAGDGFSVSKRTDGTLWAWGNNDAGQLGQSDRMARSSPTQIPGADWRRVEAGPTYVVAIKNDGTLWGWGDNTNGVFGISNDTTLFYSSPVQIASGSTGWDFTSNTKISSGAGKIFVTKTQDSELYFMGIELNPGFNLSQNHSSPVQIPGTTWESFDMSETTVVAKKTDGTVWNWGNINFPLSGSRTSLPEFISSPVQITGNAWVNVSVGKSFVVGTKY